MKFRINLKVGRKFQGPNIFDYMTVEENVEVALSGYSSLLKTFTYRRKKNIQEKIDEILEQINLKDEKEILPNYSFTRNKDNGLK